MRKRTGPEEKGLASVLWVWEGGSGSRLLAVVGVWRITNMIVSFPKYDIV